MKNHFLAYVAAALAVVLMPASSVAQTSAPLRPPTAPRRTAPRAAKTARATPPIPRTADGKPDLTGVWQPGSDRVGTWQEANQGVGVTRTGATCGEEGRASFVPAVGRRQSAAIVQ
jgi:hypothetical protein